MYATEINQNDNQYELKIYDQKTNKLVYNTQRGTYEHARKETLNFMYRGPNIAVSGGGQGGGGGNRPKRKQRLPMA